MAQFTGFQGNLIDTTPLKSNTAHGGDNLSLSELDATPQFRWMGEAAPATPGSELEEEFAQESSLPLQEDEQEDPSQTRDLDVSFDQTLRFEQSALEDGDAPEIQPTNNSTEAQELESLKYTLKTMNKTVLQLNGFLKACIPKFERMQNAIETWDGLSKQYNQIMIETERTAQVLEDTNWPGRVKEESQYRQSLIEEEQKRREEETLRELEMKREEDRKLEKERLEKERPVKQPPVRGRGRGRGTGIPMRGMSASDSSGSRPLGRGNGIGRGVSASVSSRPSRGSISRGRFS